jgi:hypothetical protein
MLLEAFCPDMQGRIVEISDSVRLRLATDATLAERAHVLAKKVRARAARERGDVACVFVHEDSDAVDSERQETIRKRVQAALERALGRAHYVLSIGEIEAWLLLFPDALAAYVSSWTLPSKYQNKDTGMLKDPKRILGQDLGTSSRPYRESDAPRIFEKALSLGSTEGPRGRNRSWEQFRADAAACCREHLRSVT